METILHDMMAESANPTIAPYAKTSECFARVTAKADTPEECEKLLDPVVEKICGLLGDDVYGVDVDSLEQVVGDGLRARGMTAKELCAKVGITEANLSILRSGKARGVRFGTINRICYHLECDVGDILKFDGKLEEEEE